MSIKIDGASNADHVPPIANHPVFHSGSVQMFDIAIRWLFGYFPPMFHDRTMQTNFRKCEREKNHMWMTQ